MPMPMGVGTQPMQLLANQQFLTAANLAGLQPITMISANQTKPEPHQLTTVNQLLSPTAPKGH